MWFYVKRINLFAKKLKIPLHFTWILVIIIKSANGGVAKWLNAAVCKTALSEFGGSNPLASIAEFYSAGCIEQQVKVQSNGL